MQFQVPQFIETEDKIIGPLTIRQFLFLAAGSGLSFFFYFIVQTWLFAILAIMLISLAAAFAFVKVNGQSLVAVLISAINFYLRPQTYVWQPAQPNLPKNEQTLQGQTKEGFSLEKVVAGFALNNAWRYLQTGSKAPEEKEVPEVAVQTKESYQVVQVLTGERRVARRIDYR